MHLGGNIMQHFKALRTISLILGFVLVIFGCATGKSKVSDFQDIEISAKAVPEGILVTFSNYSNIPLEIDNLTITFTDWGGIDETFWVNEEPLAAMNSLSKIHTHQTSESVIKKVRQTGTVTFPFVQHGRKYSISAFFSNGDEFVKEVKTECVADRGIYLDGKITLNMNDAHSDFALSSDSAFTSDVWFAHYIIINKGDNNIEWISSGKTKNLFWDFEPMFSEHLKEAGVTKGYYPALVGTSIHVVYDNIPWYIEIASSPVFTYSL